MCCLLQYGVLVGSGIKFCQSLKINLLMTAIERDFPMVCVISDSKAKF